ncbi:MAG: recombination-associated protein RdgC [Myxococcota bacterium]
MPILSGAMSVRRFRVVGATPGEGWRESYREKLQELAFKDNPIEVGKEEREGWVQIHNLLETSFEDFNKWLYNDLILLALRVDKKALPAKLVKATLEKQYAEWCEENGRKRCPKDVREQKKDALEAAWLTRALPKVATTELCFNHKEGYVILHSLSESVADRVRKRFFATFGLRLIAVGPLDHLQDPDVRERMVDTVPITVGDTRFLGGM